MSNEELKEMILSRKSKRVARAEEARERSTDVIIGRHEQGIADAIMGTDGEIVFLDKLLGLID